MAAEQKEGSSTSASDKANIVGMDLLIGPSKTNTKIVTLPVPNMEFSTIPVNKQQSNWNDKFSVKVEGDKLYVTRTDANYGWGQKLVLRGGKGANAQNETMLGSLVGNWKCLVFKGKSYWGYHDIYCHTHSSQGVVEAQLIGTQNPGKGYIKYNKNKLSTYIGVLKGDSLTLTYQDANSSYVASIILKRGEYAMDGSWTDSSNGSGTVHWVKVQKLK